MRYGVKAVKERKEKPGMRAKKVKREKRNGNTRRMTEGRRIKKLK